MAVMTILGWVPDLLSGGVRRDGEDVVVERRPSPFSLDRHRWGPSGCKEHLMVTVDADARRVERRLAEGRIVGPCGHVLSGWGHARVRVVRGAAGARHVVRPRRARCACCGVTHVLLPVILLVRRADTAAVIWAGLEAAGRGFGHRRVAVLVGAAASTARGWCRRLAGRAEILRQLFTAVGCRLDPDPDPWLPEPASSPVADVVAAVVFAAGAARRRWSSRGLTVSAARMAVAVSRGGLLAATAFPESINTSWLWQPMR